MLDPEHPLVSVIVPAYRSTKFIGECLRSLRSQSFRNFETVVVNDACPETEMLEQALKEFSAEIRYLRHDINKGVASARNTGILQSRGSLIALLDADDIWEPDYLEVQTGILLSRPDVDVVYPNAIFFGRPDTAGRRFMDEFPTREEVSFKTLLSRRAYVFIGATTRRKALENVGLFDSELKSASAEDYDLWLRLALSGARFYHHDRALVRYRQHSLSMSNDPVWMIENVLGIYRKLLSRPDIKEDDRVALKNAIKIETAQLELCLGKRAIASKQTAEAIRRLSNANEVLKRPKIFFALLGLKTAPKTFYRILAKYPARL